MDSPDRSESLPDVRKRVAELVKNEPNRFFDHRPKTPPDCSLSVVDVRQRVEEQVKNKTNRFSDLMSKTPRDRISDSSYWNYSDTSDIQSSSDWESNTSRISHVSHRDNLDTPDIQLVNRPWRNEIKKSKIPVRIPDNATGFSRQVRLGNTKGKGMNRRKQIWSGLCMKRSKIPISVTRRTKMAKEKPGNKQAQPKINADNKKQTLIKEIHGKPHETKEKPKDVGSKNGSIKDSTPSNKMDLNRNILTLTPVETTGVTECKTEGKLSQHQVAGDGSAVESSKKRSKRLKKRKERTPYFIVDDSSSDEETPIRIRRKVKRGERTLLSSDTEVNAKMHQVACWVIALPDDIGDVERLNENFDEDKSVDGLKGDQRGSQRQRFVKSVQKRWRRLKNLFKCCTCGGKEE